MSIEPITVYRCDTCNRLIDPQTKDYGQPVTRMVAVGSARLNVTIKVMRIDGPTEQNTCASCATSAVNTLLDDHNL